MQPRLRAAGVARGAAADATRSCRRSRPRIVAAATPSARKIERNLHDGAQQHLVALAVKLRLIQQPRRVRSRARRSTLLEELAATCRPRSRSCASPGPRHLPAAAHGPWPGRGAAGCGGPGALLATHVDADGLEPLRPGRRGRGVLLLPRGAPERRQARWRGGVDHGHGLGRATTSTALRGRRRRSRLRHGRRCTAATASSTWPTASGPSAARSRCGPPPDRARASPGGSRRAPAPNRRRPAHERRGKRRERCGSAGDRPVGGDVEEDRRARSPPCGRIGEHRRPAHRPAGRSPGRSRGGRRRRSRASARICRVASMPLIPGRLMSIRNEARAELGSRPDRVLAGLGLPHHGEARGEVDDLPRDGTEGCLVIDDEDRDRSVGHLTGIVPRDPRRIARRRTGGAVGVPAPSRCRRRGRAGPPPPDGVPRSPPTGRAWRRWS